MSKKSRATKGDTPDELAAEMAAVVQLKDIRLERSICRCDVSADNLPNEISHTYSASQALDAEGRLNARIAFNLAVSSAAAASSRVPIQIEATFVVLYDLLKEHSFSDAHAAAFADRNAVFNAWPYWREFVQSMTVRMGLPALTLPVFRIRSAPATADTAPAARRRGPRKPTST